MKKGERLLIQQEHGDLSSGQYLTYKGGEGWLPGRFDEDSEFVVVEVVRVVKMQRVLVDVPDTQEQEVAHDDGQA